MLDHTGFVVGDLARARRLYDAVATALGLPPRAEGAGRACARGAC
jgi:catechol 2,3-dioxygenase-like lactoylglutathione lyase family enzyme